jgi:hypothetical protein
VAPSAAGGRNAETRDYRVLPGDGGGPVLKTCAGGHFGVAPGAGVPWVLAVPGWEQDHCDLDVVCQGFDAETYGVPLAACPGTVEQIWGADQDQVPVPEAANARFRR